MSPVDTALAAIQVAAITRLTMAKHFREASLVVVISLSFCRTAWAYCASNTDELPLRPCICAYITITCRPVPGAVVKTYWDHIPRLRL